MKSRLAVLLMLLTAWSCGSGSNDIEERLKAIPDDMILAQLQGNLLGKWDYQYSFNPDTSFSVKNTFIIPERYTFFQCEYDTIVPSDLRIYESVRNNNLLVDICSQMFIGEDLIDESFHDVVSIGDSSRVGIQTYGKKYKDHFFIRYASEDTLIIKDSRRYLPDRYDIVHFYIKSF